MKHTKGPWTAIVQPLDKVPDVDGGGWQESRVSSGDHAGNSSSGAVVEVMRAGSGTTPRALLGGTFLPGTGDLIIRVKSRGYVPYGGEANYPSGLSKPLVAGLSDEFARAALEGLRSELIRHPFPAGVVDVTIGAYDEVNSSEYAFDHAARLLLEAINPKNIGPQIKSAQIGAVMAGWK